MSWNSFLKTLCSGQKYGLTCLEIEVIMCILETPGQSRSDLLKAYNKSHSRIEEEAFAQRLRNIYRRFKINGNGHKLPQLHRYLTQQYLEYQNKNIFFSNIGLNYIHTNFPRDSFGKAIDDLISQDNLETKEVDILQTFAPNLNDYYHHLTKCVKNGIKVRILLAWPYSEAAKLREEVLKKYGGNSIKDEINIKNFVIRNLEMLETIIQTSDTSKLMEIKLYDTIPSLAIYRAGNYMLAAPFLHGSLAIDTFQLELKLDSANRFITHTLQNDFELMWKVARPFNLYLYANENWKNDLKILFMS